MGKFIDLTGQKFGRFTVINREPNNESHNAMWRCICECGNERIISGAALRFGNRKSCGCYKNELSKARLTTHGAYATGLYHTYWNMIDRCNNINSNNYKNYGGRGISVCDCISTIDKFINEMSKLEHCNEAGYSLDRIDNDGDYCICKNNLKWSTQKEQNRNMRRNPGTSGVIGVRKNVYKHITTYSARIVVNDKEIYLGVYNKIEDAIKARKDAELLYRSND